MYHLFYRLLFFLMIISIDLISLNNEPKKQCRLLPTIKKREKNNKRVSFAGSIRIPESCDCSYLYLCYNGKLIKIKNEELSSFIIKDFDTNELFLIFASANDFIFKTEEDNIITSFKLKRKSNYKSFVLTKEINGFNDNELTWKIEECGFSINKINNNFEIPLKTLFVLIDPSSIDFKLVNKVWKKSSSTIELPEIFIKSIKDKAKLQKSCLAYLDIKPFHSEQEKKETRKDNIKLSMLL